MTASHPPSPDDTTEDIPVVEPGREFVTPIGKRRLQIIKFVGGGTRAKVYQTIEVGTLQPYALKVLHELSPIHLRSMAIESGKVNALASHQIPHTRIIEIGATYALKEWIDGIGGTQWIREWKEHGADPGDVAFSSLVRFFQGTAAKGVHVNDLKPANMHLRNGREWVPIDPGEITTSVLPAVAMQMYRERFFRRWLRASRSPFWCLVYWIRYRSKAADSPASGDCLGRRHRDKVDRRVLDRLASQSSPGGLKFWGQGLVLPDRLKSLLVDLEKPVGSDVEVLKCSTRRSVFRVSNVSKEIPSLIVKGFPLAKIESCVKYRKYGLAEFSHYQQAAQLGVSMPACHGYFEVRRLGVVRANGVLIEDLAGWRSLADLAQAEPQRQQEILAKAIPLLKQLSDRGVNHIDTSPQNILQSPDGKHVKLIDWQYCSFVVPSNESQLAFQATHFLNYANLKADSSAGREWLHELISICSPRTSTERFGSIVLGLQSQGKISGEDRLKLKLDHIGSTAPQHA